MELSEAVNLVHEVSKRCPSFKPDDEIRLTWGQDFMDHFGGYDCKWIWMKMKGALVDAGSNYTPTLDWLIDQVYIGVRQVRLAEKYNTRQITPEREDIPQNVVASNVAKVRQIVAEAKEKAKASKDEKDLDFKRMVEMRVYGRVLTDEEREKKRREQIQIKLDPESEARAEAIYVQHTGGKK